MAKLHITVDNRYALYVNSVRRLQLPVAGFAGEAQSRSGAGPGAFQIRRKFRCLCSRECSGHHAAAADTSREKGTERGDQLQILTADKEFLLPKKEAAKRSVQRVSLMPQSQHDQLSQDELIDLLAYLKSLR